MNLSVAMYLGKNCDWIWVIKGNTVGTSKSADYDFNF